MKVNFNLIFIIIIQSLCTRFIEKFNTTYKEARDFIYHSKLYEAIEDEETKMWYFSTHDLFEMLVEEKETGKYTVPQG